MKLDDLKRVRDYACGLDWFDKPGHPLVPLDEEIEAMQTPITAEALLADGWVETYKTEQYGGLWEFGPATKYEGSCLRSWAVECSLDGNLKRVVDLRNRSVPDITTMYDLRELVRLLGGVA